MKPNINSINVHSKLNHNVHRMDGALAVLVHVVKWAICLFQDFVHFTKLTFFEIKKKD